MGPGARHGMGDSIYCVAGLILALASLLESLNPPPPIMAWSMRYTRVTTVEMVETAINPAKSLFCIGFAFLNNVTPMWASGAPRIGPMYSHCFSLYHAPSSSVTSFFLLFGPFAKVLDGVLAIV